MSSTSSTAGRCRARPTHRDTALRLLPGTALLLLLLGAGCATTDISGPFRDAARRDSATAAFVAGVQPCAVRGMSPAAGNLYAVARYWKRPVSLPAFRRWYETQAGSLSAAEVPVQFAWKYGLWAGTSFGSMEKLKERLRHGAPVLALLQDNALDPNTRREVLAIGFDDARRMLLLCAGGPRPETIAYAAFEAAWRVNRNWMTVISPPDAPPWPLDAREFSDRARFYEAAGRFEEAVADYQAAIEAGFGQNALLVRIGNSYRSLRRIDEAEAFYRKALAADPQDGQAYNNLAYLLAENLQKLDEAERLARQALLLDPSSPLAIDTLGYVLYQQGKYAEAADLFERARARARWLSVGTQSEIALHLAWAHVRNEQPHLAREVLRDAIRLDPSLNVPAELQPLAR